MRKTFWFGIFFLGGFFCALGQIDPEKRQLFQLGFNQPLEGRGPISAYAFYLRNQPEFMRTNITLRLAIAPIYLDSELAFAHALGEQTDFAVGVAGGGFADSYSEVRDGRLHNSESFTGHGGEISSSIYHLFNPGSLIPLSGILRGSAHESVYEKDSGTGQSFELPPDHASLIIRTGLRWGGKEPVLSPALAMELSAWYEGQFRTDHGDYGSDNDRELNASSHLFWGRALLIYTLPELKHNIGVGLTTGTSLQSDRFSAYRLGGTLPLISEFPLSLPGYYFQEISARNFALLSGQYSLPIDAAKQWLLTATAAGAAVEYQPGLSQPGNLLSGVGGGFGYKSKSGSWEFILSYSYGFQAIRPDGRGGQNIGFLFQFDLEARNRSRQPYIDIEGPAKSQGLFHLFNN